MTKRKMIALSTIALLLSVAAQDDAEAHRIYNWFGTRYESHDGGQWVVSTNVLTSAGTRLYSEHREGAQLHYKYESGTCRVKFSLKDRYDFTNKGHMWGRLEQKGYLVTYPVEVVIEEVSVRGVK